MTRASREFQVFAKPAGAACNLECRYCYYLDKADLHPHPGIPRFTLMPRDLLERYIVQHIDAAPGATIAFSWHGGEPTLAGLDYFRTVVEIQRAHRRVGTRIVNGIQTNGFLLDEKWVGFLAKEGFRVGLSLDGPAEVHDRYRVNRGGEPTHARVMLAWDTLNRYNVPTDILAVVHEANVGQPRAVYRFFRSIGARSLSLLPLVRRSAIGSRPESSARVTPESVIPEAYGRFLCAIFDEWVERDTGRIQVQLFDEATRPARGLAHSLCIFRRTCGDIPVVERNGNVYSCDHFVDARHLVGNIAGTPLIDILESAPQRAFGQAKQDTLPRQCRECDVLPMCNGGCPKDRFSATVDGEPGLNYLCPAFKSFFTHVLPYAVKLAAEDPARARLLGMVEQQDGAGQRRITAAGRNDPCPCGSGRKFKKCCGQPGVTS